MIERHWKGVVRFEEGENYVTHLRQDTFQKLKTIDGFVSAKILKRDLPDGIEFLIVTTWQSIDAIKQFTGDDINRAAVPKMASDLMIRYNNFADHFEVSDL